MNMTVVLILLSNPHEENNNNKKDFLSSLEIRHLMQYDVYMYISVL